MLIEKDQSPTEKQLLKANSIKTQLIANPSIGGDIGGIGNKTGYRQFQFYNQPLNDKKMNSMSQYQLSSNNLPIIATGNRSNGLINHGTIRPHQQTTFNNQLNGLNRGLTSSIQTNNIINSYATISRAAHNQMNGPTLLTTQVPSIMPNLLPNSQSHLNTHAIYQQLNPLNQFNHLSQFQLANGTSIYAPTPQFGLEVGLDLNRNNCCCCLFRRLNVSRVRNRFKSIKILIYNSYETISHFFIDFLELLRIYK